MEPILSIRPANPSDLAGLRRVAGRDTRPLPEGDLLVAVVGGDVRAALSLCTGETIADPFHPTASLVELLQIRARQHSRHRSGTRGGVGKLALRSAET